VQLTDRIALLEARAAVSEARALYAWHATRGEVEQMVALYEPDGIFEARTANGRERWAGHDAIRAYLRETVTPQVVIPLIHNEIVTVDGDKAVGSCAMAARTAGPVAEMFPDGFAGRYQDRLHRQSDGRWLFAERRWFLYYPAFEESGLGPYGEPHG